jgi:hypothetical protein
MAKGRTRLRVCLVSARAIDDVPQRLAARVARRVETAGAAGFRARSAPSPRSDQPPVLAGATAAADSR